MVGRQPVAENRREEAIDTVRRVAAEEVVRVLSGQGPLSPVNADALVEARWSRRVVDADGPWRGES